MHARLAYAAVFVAHLVQYTETRFREEKVEAYLYFEKRTRYRTRIFQTEDSGLCHLYPSVSRLLQVFMQLSP